MMEGLTSKKAVAVQLHKEALQDMEEFFDVKGGLLGTSTTGAYKPHDITVHGAIQAAAAAQISGGHARVTSRMHHCLSLVCLSM